jgi:flagellar biosynthesis/type III secretory pathway chaperone
MSAAQRLAALDDLPARDLIAFTEGTLRALVEVMNQETTLLRAGRHREAGVLSADKTRLAQDYVSYSRAVQRQIDRLKAEAPDDVGMLRLGHERLATQMAENLKVIATARAVTEPKTYGAAGQMNEPQVSSGGLTLNRAL